MEVSSYLIFNTMTESVHLKLYNEKRIQEGGITNLFNLTLNQRLILRRKTEMAQNNTKNAFDAKDIEKNKMMAGLGYIIFFLPMIVMNESNFRDSTQTRFCFC